MSRETKKRWYEETPDAVVHAFHADRTKGLSDAEVLHRQGIDGKNAFHDVVHAGMIERVVDELKNPLAFILLIAGMVTTLMADYVDASVIFIALSINVAISLYQEGRADKAFERLRSSQVKHATVLRNGEWRMVDAAELVPGDIVAMETGGNVPADMRIIEVMNCSVNEAVLTGEWFEVEKFAEKIDRSVTITEQKNMLWMGTLVTGGSAKGVVVATGMKTELGAIAAGLSEKDTQKTPLQENVAKIARFLAYIVFVALIAIFILGVFRGETFRELFLISIAIAVAAIPEGLPAAVTVVLAIGMEQILKRGGLVRNLLAAETLGSTTVILTDKTGTLTEATMQVARVVTLGSLVLDARHTGAGKRVHEAHGDESDILHFAILASDAFIERGEETDPAKWVIHGRPVERAMVRAGLDSGLDQTELLRNYPRVAFLPFESRFRFSVALNKIRGVAENRLIVTGAPEYILGRAASVYHEGRNIAKTPEITAQFEVAMRRYMGEGMRLIGVGFHDTAKKDFTNEETTDRDVLLAHIVFAGFVVLHDPMRKDVPAAIREAKAAGARVIMLTGDNPETARSIAREAGIWHEGDHVVLGDDLEAASDERLAKMLEKTSVFARVLPSQKLRLAEYFTTRGEVVAMTGDGVNDAPALRAASIGVALGSGTEVAKEASDLVLLNNSFTIIVAAIEEGRRIVDNLRKIVAYLLSTSFSEIIVVAGALVLGAPIPLLPAQILWTNILSEGFMNFAFAFEPKEADLMRRHPREAGARNMLSRQLITLILSIGAFSGAVLIALYWYVLEFWKLPVDEARTLVFIALNIGAIAISLSLKDLRAPIWKINPFSNLYLLLSFSLSIAGLALAIYWAPLAGLLSLIPPALDREIPILLGVIVLNIGVLEFLKYRLFERRSRA